MTAVLPRLPPERRRKLVRILGLLGSDQFGERAAAAALATRLIREAGQDWDSVIVVAGQEPASPPAYEPPPHQTGWRDAALAVLEACPSDWERKFCRDLLGRGWGSRLTDRQAELLDRIYDERVVLGERRRSL